LPCGQCPAQIVAAASAFIYDAGMAYDEGLAERLRDELGAEPDVVEKKMFGGLAMLIGGNMAVGVFKDDLLVRTDPAQQDELLAEPGARIFDMVTSRPMKGWIVVAAEHCSEDRDFRRWVARGVAYAKTFPPK
jgi:TfoX/Sxy family transcriptional regulator of competence genes